MPPAEIGSGSAQIPSSRVFVRLLRMLRPHWPMIFLGLVLLLVSLPAELFPAFVWMYVVDALIMHKPTRSTEILGGIFFVRRSPHPLASNSSPPRSFF
jgi:hypothetical protein